MITAFRVRNLRAIEDSGLIPLKRINVLVGKNSSGKSTILRLLPLLRQSVEQRTRGPILWYGRLVDFGSFKNAVRNGNVAQGISLEFEFRLQRRLLGVRPQRIKEAENFLIRSREGLRVSASVVLGRSEADRVGYVKNLVVKIGSDDFSVHFDAKGDVQGVVALGVPVTLTDQESWWTGEGSFLPNILLLSKEVLSDEDGRTDWFWEPHPLPFRRSIVNALAYLAHGNTSYERLDLIASKLAYGDASRFYLQLLENPDIPHGLKYRIRQLSADGTEVRALRREVLLSKISVILETIDAELEEFAKGVRYLEPVRASAERYYREQNLAVDEIDSRGANTAMFLSSLEDDELTALQAWMKENLGFSVVVGGGSGHVEINISDEIHGVRNIADLGFGYSQVLPIILQLWNSTKSPIAQHIVAIEQPELHLHPYFQALLADVLGAATTQRGSRGSRLFVETHSDHLINRLGYLVSTGKISPNDLQIIVVSEDEFGDSIGRSVSFTAEGTLGGGWPPGFFTPGFDL